MNAVCFELWMMSVINRCPMPDGPFRQIREAERREGALLCWEASSREPQMETFAEWLGDAFHCHHDPSCCFKFRTMVHSFLFRARNKVKQRSRVVAHGNPLGAVTGEEQVRTLPCVIVFIDGVAKGLALLRVTVLSECQSLRFPDVARSYCAWLWDEYFHCKVAGQILVLC